MEDALANKRHAGKPPVIPEQLSQLIQLRVDPRLYKEMKMSALRNDIESVSEWLHQILCPQLDREDLMLPESREPAAANA